MMDISTKKPTDNPNIKSVKVQLDLGLELLFQLSDELKKNIENTDLKFSIIFRDAIRHRTAIRTNSLNRELISKRDQLLVNDRERKTLLFQRNFNDLWTVIEERMTSGQIKLDQYNWERNNLLCAASIDLAQIYANMKDYIIQLENAQGVEQQANCFIKFKAEYSLFYRCCNALLEFSKKGQQNGSTERLCVMVDEILFHNDDQGGRQKITRTATYVFQFLNNLYKRQYGHDRLSKRSFQAAYYNYFNSPRKKAKEQLIFERSKTT